MKQTRPKRTIQLPATPDALAVPACEKCHAITRFVGLESHPHNDSFDLCTYECFVCRHVQTGVLVRDDKRNGVHRTGF